jgi:hypothetical protein
MLGGSVGIALVGAVAPKGQRLAYAFPAIAILAAAATIVVLAIAPGQVKEAARVHHV